MKVLLVTVTMMVAASMATERQDMYHHPGQPMPRIINEEADTLDKQAEEIVDRVSIVFNSIYSHLC